jgi:hypothetical protein
MGNSRKTLEIWEQGKENREVNQKKIAEKKRCDEVKEGRYERRMGGEEEREGKLGENRIRREKVWS